MIDKLAKVFWPARDLSGYVLATKRNQGTFTIKGIIIITLAIFYANHKSF